MACCPPEHSYRNGEGDEGDEGDEGYEGQQADGESRRLPRWQDGRWHEPYEGGPRQEQVREGREQEDVAAGQEDVREGDRQVDRSRAEGSEGAWHQGLRGHQEGLPSLQEGARVLHSVI